MNVESYKINEKLEMYLGLSKGEPGGSEDYRRLFTHIDEDYRAALEASAKTDTVISVAEIVA